MKKILHYFTKTEFFLLSSSVILILSSFLIFDRSNYLSLFSSLIGVVSLIFCAKGNPFGQVLMIAFSTVYSIISYSFAYYGEMITYLCMTLPMAVIALWQWLAHPFKGKRSEVEVNKIGMIDILIMPVLTAAVTAALGYVLYLLNTANLAVSTVSVATSFIAAYLMFRRSSYYPLGYALNDLVLITLWIMATVKDISYLSVVICFIVFFVNDMYCFINWKRMEKRQKKA